MENQYFPYAVINHNTFIAVLGAYLTHELTPKIDALTRKLSLQSKSTHEFLELESQYSSSLMQGVFRWDHYRSEVMYKGTRIILFGILSIFEMVLVTSPSILFLTIFVIIKMNNAVGISIIEGILLVLYGIILLTLIYGIQFGFRVYYGFKRTDSGMKSDINTGQTKK